jgi:4-amino-4-deoxy-L-arabinose transferase-like glycosyltransferase
VARNFYLEGMDIRYPRIDWRGDGPGYAEMEFPLYSWLAAVLYHVAGPREIILRSLSFVASAGSLFLFAAISRRWLSPLPSLAAIGFFALNPLLARMGSAIYAEPFMFLFYLLGVHFFVRWLDEPRPWFLIAAATTTALAVLAKAPAVHLGILYVLLLLWRQGLAAFTRKQVWLLGVLAIAPPMAWYVHAHRLWQIYGNSLGVSNETHWPGLALFTDPGYIRGILKQELVHVWCFGGVLVGALACLRRWASPTMIFVALWLFAIFSYYLAAASTTRDDWAFYYHIVSVPPAALLFGLAFEGIRLPSDGPMFVRTVAVGLSLYALIMSFGGLVLADTRFGKYFWMMTAVLLGCSLLACCYSIWLDRRKGGDRLRRERSALPAFVLASTIAVAAATMLLELRGIRDWMSSLTPSVYHREAVALRPFLKEAGLLVATGGTGFDENALPVAYNAPYMFYWLDRKGFNDFWQAQSVAELKRFASRGARYYIAERSKIALKAGYESELRSSYGTLTEADHLLLFDLSKPTAAHDTARNRDAVEDAISNRSGARDP